MKVGVILGGGGVRGAAHIGVLRESQRLGLDLRALQARAQGARGRSVCVLVAIGKRSKSLRSEPHTGLGPWPALALSKGEADVAPFDRKARREPPVRGFGVPLVISAFDVPTSSDVLFDSGPSCPL